MRFDAVVTRIISFFRVIFSLIILSSALQCDEFERTSNTCTSYCNVSVRRACTDRCEDKDPQCGGNPGWPQSWCTDKSVFGGMMYDQVNEKCPKMCGHCRKLLLSFLDLPTRSLTSSAAAACSL